MNSLLMYEWMAAKRLGVSIAEYRLAANVTDEQFWGIYG